MLMQSWQLTDNTNWYMTLATPLNIPSEWLASGNASFRDIFLTRWHQSYEGRLLLRAHVRHRLPLVPFDCPLIGKLHNRNPLAGLLDSVLIFDETTKPHCSNPAVPWRGYRYTAAATPLGVYVPDSAVDHDFAHLADYIVQFLSPVVSCPCVRPFGLQPCMLYTL